MTKEFLPIRRFEQRADDNLRVEGGGNSDKPKWVLQGDALVSRAEDLYTGFAAAVSFDSHNPELPHVVEVELDGRDTAKSKRSCVIDMLENGARDNVSVVGMRGSSELLLQIPDDDSARSLASRFADYEKYDQAISCISAVKRFEPTVVIPDNCDSFKVRLISSGPAGQRAVSVFEKTLDEIGADYKRAHYSDQLVVYSVKASQIQAQAIVDGAASETLFSFRPMPRYSAVLDSLSDIEGLPDVTTPDEALDYPVIGVLDSGIAPVKHLKPWIVGNRWSPFSEEDINPAHGTFVAGVASYGDLLQQAHWVGGLQPKVFDAAVFPADGIEEDDLIDSIRCAVKLNCEKITIWNLSLSIATPIEDNAFSDFGQALDEIQDEYGVLICKSAGNCSPDRSGIKGRLHAGADSVRCITVGSVAHEKGQYDLAEKGCASPFSRKGPGPEFIVKPEVSHYGGNVGFLPDGKMTTTDVRSFGVDDDSGSLNVGTSFSTPRVASLAANIQNAIDDEFDPLLTKALIVHSGIFPGDTLIPADEKVKEIGFGVPSSMESILSDDEHSATLVLRGTLVRGQKIDIMDFPMPPSLVKDGYYTGQITLTVVYSPVLDASQGGEYCQSDIDVKFGAYDEKRERDIQSPLTLNPIGRSNPINLLLETPYSKTKLKTTETSFAQRERMLIKHGGKYSPVKKYAIDLEDLTNANRDKVSEGKLWYLYACGLYRDHIERKALANYEDLSQDFCIVITIRDPRAEAPVYEEVSTLLEENNFWNSGISVTNEAKVRIAG